MKKTAKDILLANRVSGLTEIDPSSLEFPLGGEERAAGVYKYIHDCREQRSQQRGKPKCDGYKSCKLRGVLREGQILADYTSWRVGGRARYFYQPEDLNDLVAFLRTWQYKDKLMWLGAGSNVLIPDEGFDGTVICVRDCLNEVQQLNESVFRVEAGVSCAHLVKYGIQLGWQDIAFLAGIPGTVGGAIAMNAGAFGDEIWQHVVAVETINDNGEIQLREADDFQFGYRQVKGLHKNEWFIVAYLHFVSGDKNVTKEHVKELIAKRKASQPYNEFSCGSVFKNPPHDYAARLIEVCGLKGMRIGGAKVSEKHANFIVNDHNATAADIKELIFYIVETVERQQGVKLELEVKVI